MAHECIGQVVHLFGYPGCAGEVAHENKQGGHGEVNGLLFAYFNVMGSAASAKPVTVNKEMMTIMMTFFIFCLLMPLVFQVYSRLFAGRCVLNFLSPFAESLSCSPPFMIERFQKIVKRAFPGGPPPGLD